MDDMSNLNLDTGKSCLIFVGVIRRLTTLNSGQGPLAYPLLTVLLCFSAVVTVWQYPRYLASRRPKLGDLDRSHLLDWYVFPLVGVDFANTSSCIQTCR